jgi:hypothetical protein
MRVPDPFSCLFYVAASRAQIATKMGKVSMPVGESQCDLRNRGETEPAPISPQLMRVNHADLSAGNNGYGYLSR